MLRIKKRIQRDGKQYALIEGIEGNTLLDDIAKKYSKNYHRTAFDTGLDEKPYTLLVIKRKTPLKNGFDTWYEWGRGKRTGEPMVSM